MDRLIFVHRVTGRREILFLEKPMFTVGRNPANGITIDDEFVSSCHAEMERCADGSYLLTDRDSRNGTWVNGERIRKHKVRPGDTIRFGTLDCELLGEKKVSSKRTKTEKTPVKPKSGNTEKTSTAAAKEASKPQEKVAEATPVQVARVATTTEKTEIEVGPVAEAPRPKGVVVAPTRIGTSKKSKPKASTKLSDLKDPVSKDDVPTVEPAKPVVAPAMKSKEASGPPLTLPISGKPNAGEAATKPPAKLSFGTPAPASMHSKEVEPAPAPVPASVKKADEKPVLIQPQSKSSGAAVTAQSVPAKPRRRKLEAPEQWRPNTADRNKASDPVDRKIVAQPRSGPVTKRPRIAPISPIGAQPIPSSATPGNSPPESHTPSAPSLGAKDFGARDSVTPSQRDGLAKEIELLRKKLNSVEQESAKARRDRDRIKSELSQQVANSKKVEDLGPEVALLEEKASALRQEHASLKSSVLENQEALQAIGKENAAIVELRAEVGKITKHKETLIAATEKAESELAKVNKESEASSLALEESVKRNRQLCESSAELEERRDGFITEVERLEKSTQKLQAASEKAAELSEKNQKLEHAIAEQEAQLAKQSELVQKLTGDETRLALEVSVSRKKRDAMVSDLQDTEQKLAKVGKDLGVAGDSLESARSAQAAADDSMSRLVGIRADLAKSVEERNAVQSEIQSIRSQIDESKAEAETFSEQKVEFAKLREEKKALTASVTKARTEFESLHHDIGVLTTKADTLRAENETSQNELEERDHAIAERKIVRAEIDALKAASEEFEDRRDELAALSGEFAEVISQKDLCEGELEALRSESSQLREEVGGLREARREHAQLEDSIRDLTASKDQLVASEKELRASVESLGQKATSTEGEIEEMRKQRDELKSQIERLRSLRTEARKEAPNLEAIREEVRSLRAERETFAEDLAARQKEKDGIVHELEEARTKLQSKEQKLKAMEQSLDQFRESIGAESVRRDDIEAEREQLKQEVEKAKAELRTVRSEAEAVESDLHATRGRRDAARDDLSTLEKKVGSRREEISRTAAEVEEGRTRLELITGELEERREQLAELRLSGLDMHHVPEMTEQFRLHGSILEREMDSKRRELEKVNTDAESLLTALTEARKVQQGMQAETAEADDLMEGRERHLEKLDDALSSRRDEVNRLKATKDELALSIDMLRQEVGELVQKRDLERSEPTAPKAEPTQTPPTLQKRDEVPETEALEPEAEGRGRDGGFYVSRSSSDQPSDRHLRDSNQSLFSRRPAVTSRPPRTAGDGLGRVRLHVLNLTASNDLGDVADGFWDSSGKEALPIGLHGIALASGGAIHTDLASALSEGEPILVLGSEDLRKTEETLLQIRHQGISSAIAWPDRFVATLTAAAKGDQAATIGRILAVADLAVCTDKGLMDVFASCHDATPRAYFPSPYPIAHPDWDTIAGVKNRSGVLIGGFPFHNGLESALCRETLQFSVLLAKVCQHKISVFSEISPRLADEMAAAGLEVSEVHIVAEPKTYAEYLEVLGRHSLIVDPSRGSRRMGSLAGDALLTRGICLGGDSDLDTLLFPGLQLSSATPEELRARVVELLNDPLSHAEAVADAARRALAEISFEAARTRVRSLLSGSLEDSSVRKANPTSPLL